MKGTEPDRVFPVKSKGRKEGRKVRVSSTQVMTGETGDGGTWKLGKILLTKASRKELRPGGWN